MKYRALFIVLAFFAASNRWLQAAAAVTTTDVTAGTALSATTHNTNFGNVRTALNKLNPNGWTNGGTDIGYTDGKIGIGIGVPAVTFHVVGQVNFDAYNNSAGAPATVYVRRARGTLGSPNALLNGDEIGYFATQGHDGTGFFHTAYMMTKASENWTAAAHGSQIGFFVTPNGSTGYSERMTIAQNGNVGIGTTTPATSLDVNGVISTRGDSTAVMRHYDSAGNLRYSTGLRSDLNVNIPYVFNGENGTRNFSFNNANVGIGTFTPSRQLHVEGSFAGDGLIYTKNTNASFGSGITIYNDGGQASVISHNGTGYAAYGGAGSLNIGTVTNNPFHFLQNNSIRMSIDANGRVAVATTSATNCNAGAIFCVNGAIYTNGTQLTSDARWKKDIRPISHNPGLKPGAMSTSDGAWSTFLSLSPSTYYWRKDEFKDKNFEDGLQYGFIAQNVEKAYPTLVKTNGEGFKSLNYSGIIAINTAAIQQLKREKDAELGKLTVALSETKGALDVVVRQAHHDKKQLEHRAQAAEAENKYLRAELTETKKSLVRVAQRVEDQEKKYAERLARLERNLAASTIARR
ncbi:MAG: tail fiber domain-containing protein [Turneriella sp.]